MSEYLLINIGTIAIPLILSFEKKLKFYKNFLALLISLLITGALYISWDVVATMRGDWSFSSDYILGIKFFHLPLEEILFFITVPYSCIFIYETFSFYLKEKKIFYNKKIYFYLSIIFFLAGMLFRDQNYTLIVFMSAALFVLLAITLYEKIFQSKIYWIFISFCLLPFLVVNYILTSLPIVSYNPNAIWGIRFITIPLEDFIYNFSMLSFYLLFYLLAKEKWLKKVK